MPYTLKRKKYDKFAFKLCICKFIPITNNFIMETIFLVEDDPAIRESVSKYLVAFMYSLIVMGKEHMIE
jgi:hypothetical protein